MKETSSKQSRATSDNFRDVKTRFDVCHPDVSRRDIERIPIEDASDASPDGRVVVVAAAVARSGERNRYSTLYSSHGSAGPTRRTARAATSRILGIGIVSRSRWSRMRYYSSAVERDSLLADEYCYPRRCHVSISVISISTYGLSTATRNPRVRREWQIHDRLEVSRRE